MLPKYVTVDNIKKSFLPNNLQALVYLNNVCTTKIPTDVRYISIWLYSDSYVPKPSSSSLQLSLLTFHVHFTFFHANIHN